MGSDREPTAPESEDTHETQSLTCTACGQPIDRTDWHPVRTRTDDQGHFHIDVFCSMACRAEHEPS